MENVAFSLSAKPVSLSMARIKGVASACISAIFPFPTEIFECEMSLPPCCVHTEKRELVQMHT